MTLNLDAEAKAAGLTRRGRDLLLAPHKPPRPGTGALPKSTQQLLTDAAEVGFTYWGPAPGSGYTWAVDDHQRFHAVHATTRGGARQSRHACASHRVFLDAELHRLYSTAGWALKGSEREDGYREREILRLRLALASPTCDVDGPVIVHPVISTAGVAAIHQIEVDQ